MIADAQMVSGRKDFLIVILKERMNMDKLPQVIKTYLSKYIIRADRGKFIFVSDDKMRVRLYVKCKNKIK